MTKKQKKPIIMISTKTGDTGESGLANGERISKAATVFEVVGGLDELNSWLGVLTAQLHAATACETSVSGAKSHFTGIKSLIDKLYTIQHTLFYIGAELARSPKATFNEADLHELEAWSDALQEQLAANWTTRFLLPGGSVTGAWADVARTVCRRTERVLVAYSEQAIVRAVILQYINRLSDFLYVIRCYLNQEFSYIERPFIAKQPE